MLVAATTALLACSVWGCANGATEDFEGSRPGECSDLADNDRDGLFDCEDDQCAASPVCQSGEDDDSLENDANPDATPSPDAAPDTQPEPEPSDEGPVCGDGECEAGEEHASCPEDCAEGCQPATTRCLSLAQMEVCDDEGLVWETVDCQTDEVCLEEACGPPLCEGDAVVGCADETTLRLCNVDGTAFIDQPCPEAESCRFLGGRFLCTDQVCESGETRCLSPGQIEVCDEDGRGWSPGEFCDTETHICEVGVCTSLCDAAGKTLNSIGCEYWTIKLPNLDRENEEAHAVVVTNVSSREPVEIHITDGHGQDVTAASWTMTIEPGQQMVYDFNPSYINIETIEPLIPDVSYITGTVIGDQNVFRLVSSHPTLMHQYNPLEFSYSSDASLLLPVDALGQQYRAMSWRETWRQFDNNRSGFTTILAVEEGTTNVSVTASTEFFEGVSLVNGDPIPGFGPDEERHFVLSQGQFLHLETNTETDATGSFISADKNILVFGGHVCGGVPGPSTPYCDHLEEQLLPLRTWGKRHVVTNFASRSPQDMQLVRILATNDRTLVQTNPPQEGALATRLDAGEYLDIQSADDFEVTSTEPILIAQFIRGVGTIGDGLLGDPSMMIAVPMEQWRTDYDIFVPDTYDVDYVNVVTASGNEVFIDGQAVTGWRPIGDSAFAIATVEAADGSHKLSSEQAFGVTSYGYGEDVSYALPGGLNLETIERD